MIKARKDNRYTKNTKCYINKLLAVDTFADNKFAFDLRIPQKALDLLVINL